MININDEIRVELARIADADDPVEMSDRLEFAARWRPTGKPYHRGDLVAIAALTQLAIEAIDRTAEEP